VDPSELPRHDEVAAEIASLTLGVDAAELHGSLCGYVSAGGSARRDQWLDQLALEAGDAAIARDGALDRLFAASISQLADPNMGFALLLPDDDSAVVDRAEGLLAWCRGFLGGFGLASGPKPPLSAEASEALDDLGKIAASTLSYDDPDADEAALVEVAEFVRVAALLLHDDCGSVSRTSRQLH
jgi:uncharacterized protein YgfB (UPF0149 family)